MPTPSPARCPRLPLIAIMVLSAATLSAREQPATAWFGLSKENAWLHAYDPTLISPRLLSDNWSTALTYKPKWNFLSDDDSHRVELAATHVWGSDHQCALSFSGEVPLSGDSLQWKLPSGFALYF